MLISINHIIYQLKTFGVGLHCRFDLYERTSEYSGKFYISDLYLPHNVSTIDDINLINDSLDISVNLGKPSLQKRKSDNLIDLVFNTDDIFQLHKDILKVLISDKVINGELHLLRCYNLPYICNLKCPYCSQGNYNPREYKKFDLKISSKYVILEQEFTNDILKSYKRDLTDRYMGGETFLDWSEFEKTLQFYKRIGQPTDSFRTYTNGTIPGSMKRFYEFIKSTNTYNNFDIWVSVDSLNFEKSLRFGSITDQDTFFNNLDVLESMNRDKKCSIHFNIMYNDSPREYINTVKYLYKRGFRSFKFGFDESDTSKRSYTRKFTIAPRLVKLCSKYMTPTKMAIQNIIAYGFDVTDFGDQVYSDKISFESSRSHVEIYESVLNSSYHEYHRELIKVEG